MRRLASLALLITAVSAPLCAGPYSAGKGDTSNAFDAPVPGFVGPSGDGNGSMEYPENYLNPLFFGWAESAAAYSPASGVATGWMDPTFALGPVTGDNWDITCLGDLDAAAILAGTQPGTITLGFAKPLRNFTGSDFVVFENGFASGGGAGVAGQITGELAYVEVSSNGIDFARFSSISLTPAAVGPYGMIDPTNVFNLAGKHGNAYGQSWGTPFDLSQLAADPLVIGGKVDLDAILYVRLIDIPGSGTFKDSLGASIYDAWLTFGSGGVDLEAVGAISQNATFASWAAAMGLPPESDSLDTDGDGLPDLLEYAFARVPTIPDNSNPPTAVDVSTGRLRISFVRDERAVDLTYAVQASDDLIDWTTIADSQGGQPVTGANDFAPYVAEYSASSIASVGVIRKVEVSDVVELSTKPRRFLRVKVLKSP